MQLILVAVVISWPGSVTYWLGGQKTLDPAAIEQKLREIQLPGVSGPDGIPAFDVPPPSIR